MTAEPGLVRLELENQIAASRAFLASDPLLAERYGLGVRTVASLQCSRCRVWPVPLFNRAIGAGVLAPLDEAGLDAIVRHYAAAGGTACVEVYEGITPAEVTELLERSGFTRQEGGLESHVLETEQPPATGPIAATVRRCGPEEHGRFARLVRDGFEAAGEPGSFFEEATASSLRALGDAGAAFIATVDDADAGTGELLLTPRVAGLYSGSVLPPFRGRGIQHALIAARVAEGLARGRRIFVSQTDPDSPSGHNLHDLGFRTLYRATWYVRPP